jgi:hypothetical protein
MFGSDGADMTRQIMSDYHIMKRQTAVKTLVASLIALYAAGCVASAAISIMTL